MPTRIPKELPAGGKERKGSLVANTKYSVSRIQQTVRQAHCDISLEHQLSWRPLLQVREHQHQQNRTIHSWRFWIDSQSGGGPQILPFPHLFPQLPCHRTLSVSFCPRSCITVLASSYANLQNVLISLRFHLWFPFLFGVPLAVTHSRGAAFSVNSVVFIPSSHHHGVHKACFATAADVFQGRNIYLSPVGGAAKFSSQPSSSLPACLLFPTTTSRLLFHHQATSVC